MSKPINLTKLLEDEGLEWPKGLREQTLYRRLHDDHDSDCVGHLSVIFSPDGDAWVSIDPPSAGLRFRNFFGGGRSLRTRNALMILALAMKLDGEGRPDPAPTRPTEEG